MKTILLPCLCVALLAACATEPQAVPQPPKPPEPPEPVPIITLVQMPAAPSETDALLTYYLSLRELSQAELAKELANLNGQTKCAQQALQKAMVLALNHNSADLARAQVQIDGVLKSAEPDAIALKPFAQFLLASNTELRRSYEQMDKLAQQGREAQRRIDQLNETLEALKAIERTLPSRPNGAPSAQAPAK